jgi:hypothetical protein
MIRTEGGSGNNKIGTQYTSPGALQELPRKSGIFIRKSRLNSKQNL